jgi:WD40 repeat protein
VNVWNTASGRLISSFERTAGVLSIAFDRSGTGLAIGSRDGLVVVDAGTGREKVLASDPNNGTLSVAFDPVKASLAFADQESNIKVVDTAGWRVTDAWRTEDTVYCLAFSPTGAMLASGIYDGDVQLWMTK